MAGAITSARGTVIAAEVAVKDMLTLAQLNRLRRSPVFAGSNLPEWWSCFQVWLELALKALDTGVL